MYLLINLLVFCTVTLFAIVVYELSYGERRQVLERLSEVKKIEREEPGEENELQQPFFSRVIKPFFVKLGNALGNLAPQEIKQNIERKLIQSGNPRNLTFNSFLVQMMISMVIFGAFILILVRVKPLELQRIILLTFLALILGVILPVVLLNFRVQKRQAIIQKSLPDILDILLVSVEAGLGFDMALKRVTEKMQGELSKEFKRALEEMRRGKSREEALRGIVYRTGVADLSSFITSVIQAEQLGTNIADALRIQAGTMRQKRRQRAEEAAMKAPVKMLFPLVFFIFPTLFVVILGPALIRIFQAFATM